MSTIPGYTVAACLGFMVLDIGRVTNIVTGFAKTKGLLHKYKTPGWLAPPISIRRSGFAASGNDFCEIKGAQSVTKPGDSAKSAPQ